MMTMADKIRSMSDEELHQIFIGIERNSGCPTTDEKWCGSFDECHSCWAAWLEQEVPEPPGDEEEKR